MGMETVFFFLDGDGDDEHRLGRRKPRGRARGEKGERIGGGERNERNNKRKIRYYFLTG